MLNRHDRELFWSSEMSHPERSPQNNVLVLDRGVLVNPFGKTEVVASRVLVDMYSRREDLLFGVGRDEHLMGVVELSWLDPGWHSLYHTHIVTRPRSSLPDHRILLA